MSTVEEARHASLPGVAPARGQLRLLHPTRGYAVTRNPFAVWQVLPALALTFAALAIATRFVTDAGTVRIAVAAFLVVTTGLLLIPAVALKGTLDLTHDGLSFARGKQHLTAAWHDVRGIVYRRGPGLCLRIVNTVQTAPSITVAGGLVSTPAETIIPLRMFGDRQFSILYDIRDRLPEVMWRPALEQADRRSPARIVVDYALIVAVAGVALYAVMYAVTR